MLNLSSVGQLIFGTLADTLGRKKMYGLELMLMILGSLGQALAGSGATINILGVLIFWRFVMGLVRLLFLVRTTEVDA